MKHVVYVYLQTSGDWEFVEYSQTSVSFPCQSYNASLVPGTDHCSVPCPRADIYTFSMATNFESCPYRGSDTVSLQTTVLPSLGLIRATNGDDDLLIPATSWNALERDVSNRDSSRVSKTELCVVRYRRGRTSMPRSSTTYFIIISRKQSTT